MKGAEYQEDRERLTPNTGFSLIGIDYFSDFGAKGVLYAIGHFEMYKDALDAKNARRAPDEYLVLYKDAEGKCCYR